MEVGTDPQILATVLYTIIVFGPVLNFLASVRFNLSLFNYE